jgi:transcriptional regulator GlxA family with amidase domain
VTVFEAPAVVREMFKQTRAWKPLEDYTPVRERFLGTLVDLCREQIRQMSLFTLPKARSAELRGVLACTRANLAKSLRLDDVAKQAAMSPRTLMRRVEDEIGMTWGSICTPPG